MQGSTPQHYTIADFLKWNDDKELILNPKFQRGPVWLTPARTYLIDSILRGYPIPKLLLRTQVDRNTRRTIRDVVDGQQRLRAIIDFERDGFPLGTKAKEYKGKRYSDLDDDEKDAFLSYKLTCEQLINASDDDVLEVFLRINSYAIPVNEPELRNARFDNEFSELVKELVPKLRDTWDLGVLSDRERVRMADQSVVAEVIGYFLQGVADGAEADITKLYEYTSHKDFDTNHLPSFEEVVSIFQQATDLLVDLKKEPIVQRPHFLILAAAIMYAKGILPQGKLEFDSLPHPEEMLRDKEEIVESMRALNGALSADNDDEIPISLRRFREARATTQRMKSRQPRFEFMCAALAAALPTR
ncbi:hypothetical protein Psi02_76090 [Planotetraspora silvatica]|uniref:GmrSD restriction endonucleases N-terminal domain-containing protein n=1 Tax=Planotetraspora silvatica TaxID=234614 RepID=A0A8J3XSI8_9ACTN|nr:DUF262 domain-containing protein [Planotetraspora silvatica]GII51185.1 hypothetical protein Psi02_76090 [Planotetraspora silvatica]